MLSVKQVEAAKPGAKLVKLSDGGGLQLWITPKGGRLWRLAYRHGGKQKVIALGTFPTVSLAEARQAAAQHKQTLADGRDPAVVRKVQKATTFNALADEYLAHLAKEGCTPATVEKNRWLLSFARAALGPRPIAKISAAEVLAVLEAVDTGGRRESARRARSTIGAVFRYAILKGWAEDDPTQALRGIFKHAPQHRAAITDPAAFGGLLRAIRGFDGQPTTRAALELAVLLAPRPGELRHAEWREFDLEGAVWQIPAGRMKMRRPHDTPLSRQAVAVLRDLHKLTGSGRLLFPSTRSAERPISENTMGAALRRMGYGKEEVCAHGLRASFSTLANESGKWHPDAIEQQLAHAHRNVVRRIYARGTYWDERTRLIQWWADECDRLRQGGEVVALRASA